MSQPCSQLLVELPPEDDLPQPPGRVFAPSKSAELERSECRFLMRWVALHPTGSLCFWPKMEGSTLNGGLSAMNCRSQAWAHPAAMRP